MAPPGDLDALELLGPEGEVSSVEGVIVAVHDELAVSLSRVTGMYKIDSPPARDKRLRFFGKHGGVGGDLAVWARAAHALGSAWPAQGQELPTPPRLG